MDSYPFYEVSSVDQKDTLGMKRNRNLNIHRSIGPRAGLQLYQGDIEGFCAFEIAS